MFKKDKEEKLVELREVKKYAEKDIKKNHPGYENCEIINVIHYNKPVELVNRRTGKKEKFDLHVALAKDPETEEIWEMYYLNSKEVDFTNLIKKYESATPIKDIIDATKENEEKPLEEQDKELSKEELEDKKEQTVKKEKEPEEQKNKKESIKRKPSHVIERIKPDKAKLDYWQNIKQAFNLPNEVETLAFSYPVSTEDKVDNANITVYMLDKDGYIIDDLNVDDYFKFDSSTGNNPISDNTVKFEEDENKGKVQIEDNSTMVRLKAKNGRDKNTYISLEQKNGILDYNDINAGRKTVAGTQNVEKQLETDRVRIWDSEREKILKSNAGRYNINEIFEEAEMHKEHGEEYIDKVNADGKENTVTICYSKYILGTEITWEELADETGESIVKLQERFEKELERGKEPADIVDEIEYDYGMVEHTRDRV